jgi:hypothetical protein
MLVSIVFCQYSNTVIEKFRRFLFSLSVACNVAISAAGNWSCGPTYLVGQNGQLTGGAFYEPLPNYTNQQNQNLLSEAVR